MKNIIDVKRVIFSLVFILLIILYLHLKSINENADIENVNIGYLQGNLISTPVAMLEDSNQKQKVAYKLFKFDSSNQLYDAVAKGDIDIAPAVSIIPVLINHIKDPGKVRIYTEVLFTRHTMHDMILAKNNSGIVTLRDLENKKIGVFPGSTATKFLIQYLKKNKVDTSKIEFIQITPNNQISVYESGLIHALYAYEPNVSIIMKGDSKTIGGQIYATYQDETPIVVGIISEKFAENQKSKEIINAIDNSINDIENDSLFQNAVSSFFQLDPILVSKMKLAEFKKSTELKKNRIINFSKTLFELGELSVIPSEKKLFYEQNSGN